MLPIKKNKSCNHQQHGSNVFVWSAHSNQPAYSILYCRNEWILQHPDIIKMFLSSMVQAEGFINRCPDEAKASLKRRLGYSDDQVSRAWSQNQIELSLDQSLILTMEDEARWLISNNLTTEKTVPNFLDYIYDDALKAVKPEAVKIVR